MLIISPYAKKDHVSHVHYEHGSILKFVEDEFGLGRLAASDTRANSSEKDVRLQEAAASLSNDSDGARQELLPASAADHRSAGRSIMGRTRITCVATVVTVALCACGSGGTNVSGPPLPNAPLQSREIAARGSALPLKDPARGKIQHVVIVVQENRSFNNLFYGFPGATTATYGYNNSGQKIALAAGGARNQLGHRARLRWFRGRVQRHRKHSGHGLPDEWLRSGVLRLRRPQLSVPESEPALQLRPPFGDEAVLRQSASSTCWPIRCTLRTSTRAASSRINTSSPAKRSRR